MAQIPRQNAAFVDHRGQKCLALVFLHAVFCFVPPHLFVQRIEQLLPRRCARKRSPVIKRAAKPSVIQQSFRRAVEHHAHAVQQVDNPRRRFAHPLDQRLVRQKVSAVNRVVKMFPGCVAFALLILRCVDATLRADRVRPFHRHNREQLHRHARLRDANRRHQAGQTTAHYNDFRLSHFK